MRQKIGKIQFTKKKTREEIEKIKFTKIRKKSEKLNSQKLAKNIMK